MLTEEFVQMEAPEAPKDTPIDQQTVRNIKKDLIRIVSQNGGPPAFQFGVERPDYKSLSPLSISAAKLIKAAEKLAAALDPFEKLSGAERDAIAWQACREAIADINLICETPAVTEEAQTLQPSQ